MLLQTLEPFAASPQVLDFAGFTRRRLIQGFSALLAFSQLKTLRIANSSLKNTDFFLTLPRLDHLTELKFWGCHLASPCISLDSIKALTGLKSLCLDVPKTSVAAYETTAAFSALLRLTSLTLSIHGILGRYLYCLTALVDLTIKSSTALPPYLADVISCMQHLTSIRLGDQEGKFQLPSSALEPLKELKVIKFKNVLIAPDFLETLATLPCMTELDFYVPISSLDQFQFYPQLGLLSNLVVLRIPADHTTVEIFVHQLVGRLPKLRELALYTWPDATLRGLTFTEGRRTRELEPVLLNRFPNLRRVSQIFFGAYWII